MKAARFARNEVVRALLAAPDIDVNRANIDGVTAVMIAAQKGHTEVVRALLAAPGIDVNKRATLGVFNGMMALDIAIHEHKHEAAAMLRAAGMGLEVEGPPQAPLDIAPGVQQSSWWTALPSLSSGSPLLQLFSAAVFMLFGAFDLKAPSRLATTLIIITMLVVLYAIPANVRTTLAQYVFALLPVFLSLAISSSLSWVISKSSPLIDTLIVLVLTACLKAAPMSEMGVALRGPLKLVGISIFKGLIFDAYLSIAMASFRWRLPTWFIYAYLFVDYTSKPLIAYTFTPVLLLFHPLYFTIPRNYPWLRGGMLAFFAVTVFRRIAGKHIYDAAEKGDMAALRLLLETWRGSAVLNWADLDSHGWTPLHIGCISGNMEAVRLLVATPGETRFLVSFVPLFNG